jgi:hypothetical protein
MTFSSCQLSVVSRQTSAGVAPHLLTTDDS